MSQAILRYIHLTCTTKTRYADSLYAKSCVATGFYNETTLRDFFIVKVAFSIYQNSQEYRDLSRVSDFPITAYNAQSMSEIQKGAQRRHTPGAKELMRDSLQNSFTVAQLPTSWNQVLHVPILVLASTVEASTSIGYRRGNIVT